MRNFNDYCDYCYYKDWERGEGVKTDAIFIRVEELAVEGGGAATRSSMKHHLFVIII